MRASPFLLWTMVACTAEQAADLADATTEDAAVGSAAWAAALAREDATAWDADATLVLVGTSAPFANGVSFHHWESWWMSGDLSTVRNFVVRGEGVEDGGWTAEPFPESPVDGVHWSADDRLEGWAVDTPDVPELREQTDYRADSVSGDVTLVVAMPTYLDRRWRLVPNLPFDQAAIAVAYCPQADYFDGRTGVLVAHTDDYLEGVDGGCEG